MTAEMRHLFNPFIGYFLLLLLAVLLGSVWAIHSINKISDNASFMLYNGPWRVNPVMDLKDIKQRALIAKVGLFALRESEVIYYTATKDSDGKPLNSDHTYILEGSVPNARYWSYTLYGQDNFLIGNEKNIFGYNQHSIAYTEKDTLNPELEYIGQRTFKLMISNEIQEDNWLPAGDNDALAITLRLYNPSPEVYENLVTIPLPSIRRVL